MSFLSLSFLLPVTFSFSFSSSSPCFSSPLLLSFLLLSLPSPLFYPFTILSLFLLLSAQVAALQLALERDRKKNEISCNVPSDWVR
jgi:hypothetical protein